MLLKDNPNFLRCTTNSLCWAAQRTLTCHVIVPWLKCMLLVIVNC